MLRINSEAKTLEKLSATELTSENILERYHLQEMLVNSWEDVKNEIGLPTAFLVGREIKPHESVQDSIDLLAYNQDDSSLVIIELKRDRNKLQLLQALSYAAMVSTWDSSRLLQNIQDDIGSDREELRDIIPEQEEDSDIGILLLAETFDPEVIITADWLSAKYGVDITAYALALHKIEDNTILLFEQRYPLKELSDAYETRSRKSRQSRRNKDVTWDDVIPKLRYSFAEKAVRLCERHIPGDPSRRRTGRLRSNFKGFTWISLNFRVNYINVYTMVNKEAGEEEIKRVFGEKIEIFEWRDGLSFHIDKEKDFSKLVEWLELEV